MHPVVDGQPLYEADISTGLECAPPLDGGPAVVTVQVRLSKLGCSCVQRNKLPNSSAVWCRIGDDVRAKSARYTTFPVHPQVHACAPEEPISESSHGSNCRLHDRNSIDSLLIIAMTFPVQVVVIAIEIATPVQSPGAIQETAH